MKYLYLGLNDFYLSSAAAAMHLELVPVPPDYGKLREIKHFRPFCRCDEGMFLRMGTDKRGNEVYLAAVVPIRDFCPRPNSLLPPADFRRGKDNFVSAENPTDRTDSQPAEQAGVAGGADRLSRNGSQQTSD